MKYSDLIEVQSLVNSSVSYLSDAENYGVREKWEIAEEFGDCEDYALRKLHELLDRGWDIQYLRLAFCYIGERAAGNGHCVLVAELDNQLYVLDNRAYTVYTVPENEDYIWNSCQETGGSKKWVSCEEVFTKFY